MTPTRSSNPASLLLRTGKIVSSALLLLTLSFAIPSISAIAAESNTTEHSFNIELGPLGQSLNALAEQAGITLTFTPNQVAGIQGKALQGDYTTGEALVELLEGSGLTANPTAAGFVLRARVTQSNGGIRELAPAMVSANSSNITEDTGSYTTVSVNAAAKFDLTLRETPQSISVLTSQRIQDANLHSISDVVDNIAGLNSLVYGTERATVVSRGFSIDHYQIDGMATTFEDSEQQDLVIYDRVEIVKGANGLTTGAGNPAASINYIRKHAISREFEATINTQFGSWDTYRGTLDITTPLNSSGSVRARGIVSYTDEDSFRNHYERSSKIYYAIIDADLSDSTQISIGASSLQSENIGSTWGGVQALFSDDSLTDFDPSDSFSPDWAYWNIDTNSMFVSMNHVFDNDISIKVNYSRLDVEGDRKTVFILGYPDKETGLGLLGVRAAMPHYNRQSDNLDMYAAIPFEFADKSHEFITGITYTKEKSNSVQNRLRGALPANSVYDWNEGMTEPTWENLITGEYGTATEQAAFYAVGRFTLLENLKLITGARVTNWEYESATTVLIDSFEHKRVISPYVGMVYDLNENHSIYTSYTDIFNPQTYKNLNGIYLDPVDGKNYEIGVKGEYFNQRLNSSLTLFKIEQNNVAEVDEDSFILDTTDPAYIALEGVVSNGVEINVTGEISEQWNISFGFSHFSAEDAEDNKVFTTNPRNEMVLSTQYTMGRLSIGGGIDWQSKFYVDTTNSSGDAVTLSQKAFYKVNVMAKYEVMDNFSMQLNINNLFDEEYYSNIIYRQNVFGDPRRITLALNYNF